MDDTLFETQLGALQPSFAARVTGTIGAVDIGVGLFSGVSREARFVAQVTAPEVVAAHDLIQQASLDLRWSYEGLAVKLELMGRLWSRELRFFGAAGLGPEYTLSDLFGTDLTLVAEGFVDGRSADAPLTFFDHDVFVGLRWALGDDRTKPKKLLLIDRLMPLDSGVFCGPAHPFFGRTDVTLAEVVRHPFVTPPDGVDDHWPPHLERTVSMRVNQLQLGVMVCATSDLLAVLPGMAADNAGLWRLPVDVCPPVSLHSVRRPPSEARSASPARHARGRPATPRRGLRACLRSRSRRSFRPGRGAPRGCG